MSFLDTPATLTSGWAGLPEASTLKPMNSLSSNKPQDRIGPGRLPPAPPSTFDISIDVLNSVGDIHSPVKGSGARYNGGKPDLALIPLRIIADHLDLFNVPGDSPDVFVKPDPRVVSALRNLALFQEGGDVHCIHQAIEDLGSDWAECARVFDYGKRKYSSFNWAKGMAWSIPIACAARHLYYGMITNYDAKDAESGLTHRGHVLCNLVMLLTYSSTFQEGDDRPSKWLSELKPTGVTRHDCSSS